MSSLIGARRPHVAVAILFVAGAGLYACRTDPNSARGVAEQFVDAHYVRIDISAAKSFATGLALHKVEEEQRLTGGQTIDESTRMPTVRYRLLEEKPGEDTTSFVFEGTIQLEDTGQFTRRWIVTTRRNDAAWRVSNFEELE
jgi:hypothetical protein